MFVCFCLTTRLDVCLLCWLPYSFHLLTSGSTLWLKVTKPGRYVNGSWTLSPACDFIGTKLLPTPTLPRSVKTKAPTNKVDTWKGMLDRLKGSFCVSAATRLPYTSTPAVINRLNPVTRNTEVVIFPFFFFFFFFFCFLRLPPQGGHFLLIRHKPTQRLS